ncbi:MAG: hypothetical protein FJ098_17270, partial [Deltaproteobacteria bacterium]|nr:hypothetical protein [Deltaproteobacteria bacterium]
AVVIVAGEGLTGRATGSRVTPRGPTPQQVLWEGLATYEDTYLMAYADYFQSGDSDPLELLNAFNELAYKVTGAGGIWRDTVPNKYFGCQANEDFAICVELRRSEEVLSRWDAFQEAAGAVETPLQASRFLVKHGAEMQEYLDTYVPRNDSLSAIQATSFFSSRLAPALEI